MSRQIFIKKILLYGILAIIIAGLQTSVFPNLKILGVMPVITIPITVAVAIREENNAGIGFGLFLGLLMDGYSGSLGLNILFLAAIGFAAAFLVKMLLRRTYLSMLLISLAGLIVYSLLMFILYDLLWGRYDILYFGYKIMLPEIAYSLIWTLPSYLIAMLSARIVKE